MSLDFVNVRFEIEGLGKKLAAAIITHSQEMQESVNVAVKQLADRGRLQEIITVQVEKALIAGVERAVSGYAVQQAIEKIVLQALNEAVLGEPK